MAKVKCGDCRRKFKNQSALAMHNRTVHPSRKAKPAHSRKSTFFPSFLGALLGVLIVGGLLVLSAPTIDAGAIQKAVLVRR